ncbi:DUF1467 family protein [Pararhodobacter sp.]|uniref:DUF1467 family protein n=1 Tax=Pararhodobacter sp. TaxID=2127056 RepID=UPI002FDD31BC
MTLFSAFVLFAVIWFLTLFIVLPLRLTTQGEAGVVVPGTPQSAPADAQIRKRMLITTGVALVIWGSIVAIVLSEAVGMEDIDVLFRWTYQDTR